jgi:hypothetical protein
VTRRNAWFALLASFGVYLLPVVGPHFVSLWGVVLWRELTYFERASGWLAADLALALGLQAVAALSLYVILRRGGGWRWVTLVFIVPALFMTLESAYMAAIPTYFLIDDDPSPELRAWDVECTIQQAAIVPVRSGVELALEKGAVAWIARGADLSGTALLSMPDCHLRDIPLDTPHAGGGLQWVTADGAAFFTRWDRVAGEQSYWFLSSGGQEQPLEAPPGLRYWSAVVSTGGHALAWIDRVEQADGSRRQVVVLRRLSGEESRVELPIQGSLDLVSFESDPERFTLSTGDGEVFAVDREGHLLWGPARLDGIEHPYQNFRRLDDGWVAWDGYRDEGAYRVAWSLSNGDGVYEVPKGRSITSVTVEPSGRLIGVSVSPAYNIGSVRDAVFVLRTKDGREVYRRYFPPYSRSEIAFLGSTFFAMNLYEEGQSEVAVLRVPHQD